MDKRVLIKDVGIFSLMLIFIAVLFIVINVMIPGSLAYKRIIPTPIGEYLLTVSKIGNGEGTVTSNPAGINCGSDCTHYYINGTIVNLSATPSEGSTFNGWSGACSGSGICTVLMNAHKNVTASFNLENQTNQTHSECISNTCTLVAGDGIDECSTNTDCLIEMHSECINLQCVEVEGAGVDECSVNNDCSICGDGTISGNEVCDSNSQNCSIGGYNGIMECNLQCSGFGACNATEWCGDGFVNGFEECDDGNANNEDGCSSLCEINQSLPDLDIINMWVNVNTTTIPGNSTTNSTNITTAYVYVTVKNIGSSTAGQSRTQVDVNPSYTPRNILTPSLAPNAQATINDWYVGIAPGNYNVTAYADILFQVNESNENNNGHGPVLFNVFS